MVGEDGGVLLIGVTAEQMADGRWIADRSFIRSVQFRSTEINADSASVPRSVHSLVVSDSRHSCEMSHSKSISKLNRTVSAGPVLNLVTE